MIQFKKYKIWERFKMTMTKLNEKMTKIKIYEQFEKFAIEKHFDENLTKKQLIELFENLTQKNENVEIVTQFETMKQMNESIIDEKFKHFDNFENIENEQNNVNNLQNAINEYLQFLNTNEYLFNINENNIVHINATKKQIFVNIVEIDENIEYHVFTILNNKFTNDMQKNMLFARNILKLKSIRACKSYTLSNSK